jgi:hypothetical protein
MEINALTKQTDRKVLSGLCLYTAEIHKENISADISNKYYLDDTVTYCGIMI